MARISFTAIVAEIVGKLAGSVFQYSYGGYQIRTRTSPRNPQSPWQQLRRGDFGFLSASWRGLTSTQRQSFIDNAASPSGGFNLFINSNVNLILIEQPQITTYVPSTQPDGIEMEIISVTPTAFLVRATGAVTTVPTGTSLLLYATTDKLPTKIFTNPSEYSPITIFPAGTDMLTIADVITDWNDRYGELREDRRICIKSAVIDNSNGLRSDENNICANTDTMAIKFIPLKQFTADADSDGSINQTLYSYNIPGNTLQNDGDSIIAEFFVETQLNVGGNDVNLTFMNNGLLNDSSTAAQRMNVRATIMRIDSSHYKAMITMVYNNAISKMNYYNVGSINWLIDSNISITATGDNSPSITAHFGYVYLVKLA